VSEVNRKGNTESWKNPTISIETESETNYEHQSYDKSNNREVWLHQKNM